VEAGRSDDVGPDHLGLIRGSSSAAAMLCGAVSEGRARRGPESGRAVLIGAAAGRVRTAAVREPVGQQVTTQQRAPPAVPVPRAENRPDRETPIYSQLARTWSAAGRSVPGRCTAEQDTQDSSE
jgi:hypothetical protein